MVTDSGRSGTVGARARCFVVAACFGVLAVAADDVSADSAEQKSASLLNAQIIVPAGQPRFVSRAVEDLQRVVAQAAGSESRQGGAARENKPVVALVVSKRAIDTPEGFILHADRDARGAVTVRVEGHDSAGLKFGLVELISVLELAEGDARVPIPLHIERKPLLGTRSMYAHLHWAYRHPYALRSWRLDDWKRYLDLLTHLGFNTVQIWPMMELLPHPLSAEDREYLEGFAEIVEYAHTERGMRVFIGSCPNSITEDSRGVPIGQREYWEFEKRLNPGDPVELQRILEARSDLYQVVPNADGYWVIDSDPGGWRGSPSSDFVSVLAGHRGLIDRYGARPARQPLIYWMWYSWGPGSREENWRLTLLDAKRRLPEPWRLFVCLPEQFEVCREVGVLERAMYFPYNLVETEPAAPLTECRFPAIDAAVAKTRDAGLDAIQGNAQTPLVQLPNIARLSDAAWQDSRSVDPEASLRRLAGRLVSQDSGILVRAWQSLGQSDEREADQLAARCRKLADDADACGTLSVVLGEWRKRIIVDQAYMLEIRAAALRFATVVDRDAPLEEKSARLREYLRVLLAWLERTGYHNDRIVTHEAYKEPVSRALKRLEEQVGEPSLQTEILQPASRPANESGSAEVCRLIIETLLGRRK